MHMASPWTAQRWAATIMWMIYLALFILDTALGEDFGISQHYPWSFLIFDSLCELIVAGGIYLHAIRVWSPRLSYEWRYLATIALLDFFGGEIMDALMAAGFNLRKDGATWMQHLIIDAVFVFPAFYANFRLAFRPLRN